MCRFIVYHGPAITMSTLITEPEHAMLQLAVKAKLCATRVNSDGFGICWYTPGVLVPGVFKDATPAWSNPNLKQIARAVKSNCFFAHVRAASAGGINFPNCHPFTYKNISFMHNGTVPYFKQLKAAMLARVSESAAPLVRGTTDSEVMFAMFVSNFETLAGEEGSDAGNAENVDVPYAYTLAKEDRTQSIAAALRATLRQVHYITLEHEYKTGVQPQPPVGEEPEELDLDGASQAAPLPETVAIGRLNLSVSDGQSTCTSRYASSSPDTAHSLYYSMGSRYEFANNQCQVLPTPPPSPTLSARNPAKTRAVVVSSEPLAAGFNCEVVPINHMVVTGPDGYGEVASCV